MKEKRPSAVFLEARTLAQQAREAEAIELLMGLLEQHPTYWKATKFLVVDLRVPIAEFAARMARRAIEEVGRKPDLRGDAARVLVSLMYLDEARDLVCRFLSH